tara:strand:- start:16743 stop:17090 length:348 start_codon:yes stop_codon:yes gene_type:complete
MGISRDWAESWKHPHEDYSNVIDYDGIRPGAVTLKTRHRSPDDDFLAKHQDKLLLRRLGEEVKRATRIAGLETVEELMFLLSTVVYGVSRETWVIHRSEGLKRPGQICKRGRCQE